jgi:hypothetical protein
MMDDHGRDLLEQAARLRQEAGAVLADLGVPTLFATLGTVEPVGSAACGLALSRDIDLDVLCASPAPGVVWDALRPLAEHPRVKKLRWSDERGAFNSQGRPEADGLYCGVHYYAGEVRDDLLWKIDCWFFAREVSRPAAGLRNRLLGASAEERLAILHLKEAAIRAGRYGWSSDFQGHRIYAAVLDRGVRNLEDV